MNQLTLIGYWRSESEPDWPDPAWFVEPDWDQGIRQQIISYLQAGKRLWGSFGPGWCRFQCETGFAGSYGLTDGCYCWPTGLVHYVREHNVRLPDEFVQHALASGNPSEGPEGNFVFHTDWWLAQKGWREGSSFLRPVNDGEIYLTSLHPKPTIELLRFLRKFSFLMNFGTVAIVAHLRSERKMLVAPSAPYRDFLRFKREAKALGIKLEFREFEK